MFNAAQQRGLAELAAAVDEHRPGRILDARPLIVAAREHFLGHFPGSVGLVGIHVVNGSVTRWVNRHPGSARCDSQPITASSITNGENFFTAAVVRVSVRRWRRSAMLNPRSRR